MSGSAQYKTVVGTTSNTDLFISADNALVCMGYSMHESAGGGGGVFELTLYDGTVGSGEEFLHVEDAADESREAWFGPEGIATPNGISFEVVQGTIDLSVYYRN